MVTARAVDSSSSVRLSFRHPNENIKASNSSLVFKRSPSLKKVVDKRRSSSPSSPAGTSDEDEEEEYDDMTNQEQLNVGINVDGLIESETIYPPATSQVEQLNRELKALETRYFRTRLQLEKATSKVF
jgi:hypothetical protein